jgi:hypothetical protein
MDREYLIPREVAAVLGTDPQYIRVAAKQEPERLGFPVCIIGCRVKVPRRAFIAWMEGRNEGKDEGYGKRCAANE